MNKIAGDSSSVIWSYVCECRILTMSIADHFRL